MMAKEPRKHRVPIMLSDEELAALDDWQFGNKISTRSNAIRRLLKISATNGEGSMMAKDTPSRKLDQFPLRFPDGMRDELKAAAKANGRSLNAEIICKLGVAIIIDNEKNKILNDSSNALSEQNEQEDSLKLAAKRLAWTIAENDVLRATEQIPQILSEMEKLKNNFLLKQLAEKRAALQKILDRTALDLTDKQKVGEARRIAEIALLDADATD